MSGTRTLAIGMAVLALAGCQKAEPAQPTRKLSPPAYAEPVMDGTKVPVIGSQGDRLAGAEFRPSRAAGYFHVVLNMQNGQHAWLFVGPGNRPTITSPDGKSTAVLSPPQDMQTGAGGQLSPQDPRVTPPYSGQGQADITQCATNAVTVRPGQKLRFVDQGDTVATGEVLGVDRDGVDVVLRMLNGQEIRAKLLLQTDGDFYGGLYGVGARFEGNPPYDEEGSWTGVLKTVHFAVCPPRINMGCGPHDRIVATGAVLDDTSATLGAAPDTRGPEWGGRIEVE